MKPLEPSKTKVKKIFLVLLLGLLIYNIFADKVNTEIVFKSKENIDRLEEELKKTEDYQERVKVLLELFSKYARFDIEKARDYAVQAIELSEKINYKKGIADGIHSLGFIYYFQGNYSLALEYYSRSLKIKEELGDKRGIAQSYNNIGVVCRKQGNYSQAMEYYWKNLRIHEELNDKEGIAVTYNNIGLIYLNQGNYSKSMEYYLKSLKIKEELGDKKGIAHCYNNIGNIYGYQENYNQAMEYFFKSLRIKEELGDKLGITSTYNNIGEIYTLKGNYSEALAYYYKSIKICEELGNQSGIADINKSIGEIYLKQKKYSWALDFFLQSKIIFEKTGNKPSQAYSYLGIGECYLAMGRNIEAIEYLTRGCKIGQAINSPDIVKNAAEKLSSAYNQMRQFQEAYQYLRLFKETNDNLRNEATVKKITQLQMQYEFEQKQKQRELEQKKRDVQKETELKEQRFLKYIFSGIAVLLALVFYTIFRLKVKVNRKLNKEIRERQQAQKQLRQSEEKFRVLTEKSVVGICIIQNNAIQYANPKFIKLFRYEEGEILGKNLLELVSGEDRTVISLSFEKHRTDLPDSASFEFAGVTKEGGIIYLEAYGTVIPYQDKPALLETVIDITDRKKAEIELLRSMKLATVGILSGGIVHDFNNLLIIISLNLNLLKNGLNKSDSQLESFIVDAEKASKQAAELVSKFLTLADGGWISMQKITLSDILEDVLASSPKIKSIPFFISLADDLKPIYGDEHHLCQVIVNLLLNANDAVSHKKRDAKIRFSAQNTILAANNQLLLPNGEYVKISVTDNGKGIPQDMLGKIFDPYFSTKERGARKGMGLGLALCYAIVKKHGGHVSVDSVLNKGTTVDLYLPVYHEN
jgi:PAS domain S-box-containing protein